MYAPPLWLILLGLFLVAAASAGALYLWPWSRQRRRIVIGVAAAVLSFLLWRLVLISANGANFDIDYPLLLGLSYEDIGSGIMAFLFAALAFGLWSDRGERAERVVKSAALVGIAATLVDRFV
jgi:hypothetical protein